ncbi:hypothetical protein VC83_06118 [Pseudogymnoascus destructans]|uniref:Uncharacterized protein n=1 Tax=Pseudogymnoascus destructans TaxID=655981 RepID=A0A177A9U5_9PEZI|nr:uncharacterized protein VC83_06118 [Pseudogymnoascus destructans]OAF58905.1 hypothetical protein VC83_06118 [Pseudogymnoascus destructans]
MVTVHGELMHYQGPLNPITGRPEDAAFNQLFFYDPDEASNMRLLRNPNLDSTILRCLHVELMEYNPLIQRYATACECLRQQEQLPVRLRLADNSDLVQHGVAEKEEMKQLWDKYKEEKKELKRALFVKKGGCIVRPIRSMIPC